MHSHVELESGTSYSPPVEVWFINPRHVGGGLQYLVCLCVCVCVCVTTKLMFKLNYLKI